MKGKGGLIRSLICTLLGAAIMIGGVSALVSFIIYEDTSVAWIPLGLLGLLSGLIIGGFSIDGLHGEILYHRIKSGKYIPANNEKELKRKAKEKAKKYRAQRKKEIYNLATQRDKETAFLNVLHKEKALAKAEGRTWDPPESYRSYFAMYE